MNPNNNTGRLASSVPISQSPRIELETSAEAAAPVVVQSSRNAWLIGTAIGALILASGTFAYSKYQAYRERAKKDKIYRSKQAQKYKKRQAAFHADGTPMTEEEMLTPSFLREPRNRKELRRLRLYFDQEDNMLDEESALKDVNNYYHKYHVVEVDMIKTHSVEGDDDDYDSLSELINLE